VKKLTDAFLTDVQEAVCNAAHEILCTHGLGADQMAVRIKFPNRSTCTRGAFAGNFCISDFSSKISRGAFGFGDIQRQTKRSFLKGSP
jgi:hypothetical protein